MKEKIKNLIKQNKFSDAIHTIESYSDNIKIKKTTAALEGRYNSLKMKMQSGVLSNEQFNLELNNIRLGLLELCDDMELLEKSAKIGSKNTRVIALTVLALIMMGIILGFKLFGEKKMICADSKIAIMVADFQTTKSEHDRDGFANSLVTRLDNILQNDKYDVQPIGHQTRKVKRYDDFIKKEFFDSSCDSSGIFINGYLNTYEEVFNMYITIANLEMEAADFMLDNSISLDNPSGMEFSISNDVKFMGDFLAGILKCFEGYSYQAMETFFALEKSDNQKILNDKNFKANLAHFKGNCYAIRGDNARAKREYNKAVKYGNSEVKKSARNNMSKADEINEEMKVTEEGRAELTKNVKQHDHWETELEKVLSKIGGGLVDIFKAIK